MLFQALQVTHLKRMNSGAVSVCVYVCVSVLGLGAWRRVVTYMCVLEKEMHRAKQRPEEDPQSLEGGVATRGLRLSPSRPSPFEALLHFFLWGL